ncbi:MAG: lytic transglycosylase domain-containing protein, partial [Caulobacteraceae bacterium]
LYGAQGPASQDMLRWLPSEQQSLALARMAVRRGDPGAQSMIDALPPALQTSAGLAYERVLALVNHGDDAAALPLVGYLAIDMPGGAGEKLWRHGHLVTEAMALGAYSQAYAAAAHAGLASGSDAADAAFRAGWIALTKLHDPRRAEESFARLQAAGQSPLTQSRALYWRARAAEAMGDAAAARLAYGEAAKYHTAFYGQLAADKIGETSLRLGHDPEITSADRDRFQSMTAVRAARLIAGYDIREGFKTFVAALAESMTTPEDEAMLVDLARGLGDQELAMRVVRNAAKHDIILPERGYPVRSTPFGYGMPEPAFVLAITRQESSFDPAARSGAGARGMMQLMPATAAVVARRLGIGSGDLGDADYNMRLGASFLGQLVDQFSGSYVMAAAAYNAGPGRPTQWAAECGDPRSTSSDPVNFIECIPFAETRDYVMRVLEAMEVYRARLHGGEGRIALAADLKRGAYGYGSYGSAAATGR